MPLFFLRRPFSSAGGHPDPQSAASPLYLAANTTQGSGRDHITASPLVFPRYLDGRDTCACVFSLPPVNGHWVDVVLRQLCGPRHAASEKCTRGGAKGDGGFADAREAVRGRRSRCRASSVSTQRVTGSPPQLRIKSDNSDDAAAAGIWSCGLRLVWREGPMDTPPSGDRSAAEVIRTFEGCDAAGVGSRAEGCDIAAYPTHFRAPAILNDDGGAATFVTADACDSVTGSSSHASAETRTPLALHPGCTHPWARYMTPGPDGDPEALAWCWCQSAHKSLKGVEEAGGGGQRGNALSPLLSPDSPQRRRVLREAKAKKVCECQAGLGVPLHADGGAHRSGRSVHATHHNRYSCAKLLMEMPDAPVLGPDSPHAVNTPPLRLSPSLLPARSQWVRKRPRSVLKAEPLADLTVRCGTAAEVGEAQWPPQTEPGPCRRGTHWPRLCSSVTPNASSHSVGAISVSGSLPQRCFAEMECLRHFSLTVPPFPYPLHISPGDGEARWSMVMLTATWLQRETEGGHDSEATPGGARHTIVAEVAAGEAFASAKAGVTAVAVPRLTVVCHARLRCLMRDKSRGCDGAERPGCRVASEVLKASPMSSTTSRLTAEGLSAQWGAFVAGLHESRMAQERHRASFTHEQWESAAASLSNVSDSVADILALLPHLHLQRLRAARHASHRKRAEQSNGAPNAGTGVLMCRLGQAYPYPVLEWWRWASCSDSRTHPPQHSRQPPHRPSETYTFFHSASDGVEATGEQLVMTLLCWVRGMSDVQWRAASWLPWDSWIAAICAVAGVPLLLFPLSCSRASLLMPSISRLQNRLRISATEDGRAPPAARLSAGSLILDCGPTEDSTGNRALERQPWSALDAVPHLLTEAATSATLRPRWLLSSVAQRGASDEQQQHRMVRAAAAAECETLARTCERCLRTLSQEQKRGAAATAATVKASAACTLDHCLPKRRRFEKAVTVATSGDGHERSNEVAAARVSAPPPHIISLSSLVTVSPSSPAVECVAQGHADSAAVDLLGEHARSPPSTVPLLGPSKSPSVSGALSVEGECTGDLSVSEAVGRKHARSAVASPPPKASPLDSAIATASFACSARVSSPQVASGESLSSSRFTYKAQRSSTPQRMLAAWLEQRCREEISAADDSPSCTPSSATVEATVVPSSRGSALLGPRTSLLSSPPLPVSSGQHSCFDSDRLWRGRRWLLAPPSPTRLPVASLQQRWRCTDAICDSAGLRTPTTHASVSRLPARWRSCTRQALLQDALSAEPLASVVQAPEERVGAATGDATAPAPITCVDEALQSPTDQSTETATIAGGNSGITLSVRLPVKPPRRLGVAPMKSAAVWRWAQLTLHNYAAYRLDSAIFRSARTSKPSLRATHEAIAPVSPTTALQMAAHLSASVVLRASATNALAGDSPLRALPPTSTAPRGQSSTIKAVGLCLFTTAALWRQRGARRAVQRLTFYRLVLTHDPPPPSSLPLLSRPLSQDAEGEDTALLHDPGKADADAASRTARADGASAIGAQLYRDELERNNEAELAQCVCEALVCAQHTACVSIFERRIECGEGGGGKLAETQRSTDACRFAATHSCAFRNAAPDGSCRLVAARLPAPPSSRLLLAPGGGHRCVAREARLHRIVLDGMRRDGWLVFHTLWYDALSEFVSADSPQAWPGCLLNAMQGSVATHAAPREGDGPAESTHGAFPQAVHASRARVQQRGVDFVGVRVDTEPDEAALGASVHEMRWYVDTSDEDDEWREAEDEVDETVAPNAERGSSPWCCCCLASHADLIHTIMTQGGGLAAALKRSVVTAPTLERSESHCESGAEPPLCPAWWRGGATTSATTTSAASSTSQRSAISANARAAARTETVRRACRRLFHHHLDVGDRSVSPALTPQPLPRAMNAGRRRGAGKEGVLEGEDSMRANDATARFFFARLRRYASQLLCRDALPTRSAAVTAVAAGLKAHRCNRPSFGFAPSSSLDSSQCCYCSTAESSSPPSLQLFSPRSKVRTATPPAAQQSQDDEDDVEEQVAPLRRCRYTRHVCTFAEEAQSLQTWLLPHWWAGQQQRFALCTKAQQLLPLPRRRRCLGDPLNGSGETGTTAAHDDVDGEGAIGIRAHLLSLGCSRARSEEAEAWAQLLHIAHLRQLRRPYGPLFHGKCPLRCGLLSGCVADAEVHHTYLLAMLRQRTKASAER